jgi:phosphoadenosine phosphosulfate reductase
MNRLSDEAGRSEAARLDAAWRKLPAEEILAQAMAHWPQGREGRQGLVYVASFGAESAVLLALIARIDAGLPVLFIDTGKHFFQTLQYRQELTALLGLTGVHVLKAPVAELKAGDPDGRLHERDSDACCALRKVAPLNTVISGFPAWITGRKRMHGGARATLPVVEHADTDTGGQFKVNPLADWTREDVEAAFVAMNLPRHPLTAQGYASIGCWPCTRPVAAGEGLREGRWAGQDKTECGLHTVTLERKAVF